MSDEYQTLDAQSHFAVEYSEPYTQSGGHTWNRNGTEQIICVDAYRALEIFRDVHPEAKVHVLRRLGTNERILIDPVVSS